MVYPALLPLMRTPRVPVVDWTDAPADINGLVRFARKTKSGFSACAITFQTQSTFIHTIEQRLQPINSQMTPSLRNTSAQRLVYTNWHYKRLKCFNQAKLHVANMRLSNVTALHARSAIRNWHNSTSYVLYKNQLITETYVSNRTIKMKNKTNPEKIIFIVAPCIS